MSELFSKIGEMNPSYLLADAADCNRIAVSMEPGNGVVKRGTVIYRKPTNGMYAPAESANITTANMLAVLDADVDTDANATIAEDAIAFRKAHLITGKVITKDGAVVTAAHAIVLRMQGILLDPMDDWTVPATDFDNKISG